MDPKSWLSIFCTILMILVAVGIYRRKTGRESNRRFFILVVAHALTLFADSFYWALDGIVGGIGMSIIFVAIYTLCSIMLTTYHYYLRAFWKEHYGISENWRMRHFPIVVMMVFILLWISSFYNHIFFVINPDGSHYYTVFHPLSQTGILLILLPDFLVILKEWKKMGTKNSLFWLSLPAVALIVRYFDLTYDLPLVYPTIALFLLGIFIFVNAEMDSDVEKKLMEVRESMGKVMVSQIQPHFLYNVLNSISILCHRNPEKASVVTDKFAKFLRWNINSVYSKEPVSIAEEISHTETYLELEKERFGDILTVEWDVEDTSFFIPPLVLQPLVENAVRHGVCQKEDGGTVSIRIFTSDSVHMIVISDDGVGFDPSSSISDDKLHVGLSYAREQVEDICNGEMDVESEIGKGTRITLALPLESNSDFSLSSRRRR